MLGNRTAPAQNHPRDPAPSIRTGMTGRASRAAPTRPHTGTGSMTAGDFSTSWNDELIGHATTPSAARSAMSAELGLRSFNRLARPGNDPAAAGSGPVRRDPATWWQCAAERPGSDAGCNPQQTNPRFGRISSKLQQTLRPLQQTPRPSSKLPDPPGSAGWAVTTPEQVP